MQQVEEENEILDDNARQIRMMKKMWPQFLVHADWYAKIEIVKKMKVFQIGALKGKDSVGIKGYVRKVLVTQCRWEDFTW